MPALSPKAQELVALLTRVAEEIVQQRGWSCKTTAVTLFCPQKATAAVLGVDPSTIRRWFYRYPELRQWVGTHPHYTSIRAGAGKRTVIDGMLWTIRLREGRGEVRVPIEDLRHSGYRNLERDIQQGRTLHGSKKATGLSWGEKVKVVLGWAFGLPDKVNTTLGSCDAGMSLEDAVCAVEDGAPPAVLAAVVASELKDVHSVRFWIRECRTWAQEGRLWTLKDAIRRAQVDSREGFARNPAALLVSRLRPTRAAPG